MHRYFVGMVTLISTGALGCSGAGGESAAGEETTIGASVPRAARRIGEPPALTTAPEGESRATTSVRIANLTSDAPLLDVCLRLRGGDASAPFDIGPVLRGNGLEGGLS